MKNKIYLILILLIPLLFTACTNKEDEEYYKNMEGTYTMYELKTAENKIYSKIDLEKAGYIGILELNSNKEGTYTSGTQKNEIKFDKEYFYYPTLNDTKDKYKLENGDIILINSEGTELKFKKEKVEE